MLSTTTLKYVKNQKWKIKITEIKNIKTIEENPNQARIILWKYLWLRYESYGSAIKNTGYSSILLGLNFQCPLHTTFWKSIPWWSHVFCFLLISEVIPHTHSCNSALRRQKKQSHCQESKASWPKKSSFQKIKTIQR